MQKPTLCIYTTPRAFLSTRECINTHEHLPLLVFEDFLLKVPTFQKVKNKRLVNALKICLLPHPVTSMQTPQREFAGAKVQLFFDIHKKICTFDADLLILIRA